MGSLKISFKSVSSKVLNHVMLRIGYLYPDIKCKKNKNSLVLEGKISNKKKINKEISYLVYREKIYQETLPIKKKIFSDF